MLALTVQMMRSKDPRRASTVPSSLVAWKAEAPKRRASASLERPWEITLTSAPMAAASFTPTCPRPPIPTMATRVPGPAPYRRSGEYMVIPAHSRGAAASKGIWSGMRQAKSSETVKPCE